jgi:hypothetical protein
MHSPGHGILHSVFGLLCFHPYNIHYKAGCLTQWDICPPKFLKLSNQVRVEGSVCRWTLANKVFVEVFQCLHSSQQFLYSHKVSSSQTWTGSCSNKILLIPSHPAFVTVQLQIQCCSCPWQWSHSAGDILGWMPYAATFRNQKVAFAFVDHW